MSRLFALLVLSSALAAADGGAPIVYNRDVRPILAENCFACHGPDKDKRKAGLALHSRELATMELSSGDTAVVPGDINASTLIARLVTDDEDERMPPAKTGKHLTPAQIDILRRWIAQGAEWQPHWAYLPPQATAPAKPTDDRWSRNDIDRFILTRLRSEKLQPSAQADPVTLVRRLSFDLVGLPPSAAEVEAFVANPSDAAYEALVDRLLASPHFGERMAVGWLDLVRYADTIGYHSDNARNVSPYRDWVIAAFNDDMPFDRFTTEQLAGDLLPDASITQKIASTYNRLTLTTEEGGAQPKEYEAKSTADRVRNVSSVWLGSTMACNECHDHKYDPFSARDFYSMGAFFADVQENPIGAREPGMVVPTTRELADVARIGAEVQAVQRELDTHTPALAAAQAEWEKQVVGLAVPTLGPWWSVGPYGEKSALEAYKNVYNPEKAIDVTKPYADGKAWAQHPEWIDGTVTPLTGPYSATYLHRVITAEQAMPLQLSLGSDDTITVWLNGEKVLDKEVYRGAAPDQEKITVTLKPGANTMLMKIVNGVGGYAFYFKALVDTPAEIIALIRVPLEQRTPTQAEEIAKHYRARAPLLDGARAKLADLEKQRGAVEAGMRRTLVTTSGPPRTVRIKRRGDWMDEGGDIVEPAVPHFMRQIASQGRATRLDLAKWLVSRDQPLTARVLVNRLWKQLFGIGLSKSLEDFGAQGEWPVHPELLDWLAVDLMDHGWSVKRSIKQMVMSSAYRQASQAGPLQERDPDNRLVARQSRFRLEAELVRDNALAISGLLSPAIGGASVKPYQPEGYWMHLNFPAREWTADQGDAIYRRGLYTFWCRTFLQPSLLAFDASSREQCVAERARSNTPLQALALLNDPTYVEAARAFAEHIIADGGKSVDERITWAFHRALSRAPLAEERALLATLLGQRLTAATSDPDSARKLLAVGRRPLPTNVAVEELAAWTAVGRAILNLHETITRY